MSNEFKKEKKDKRKLIEKEWFQVFLFLFFMFISLYIGEKIYSPYIADFIREKMSQAY